MDEIVIRDQLAALMKEIRAQTAKLEVVSATLDRITAKSDWATVKPVTALAASSSAAATSMVSPVQPAAATFILSLLDVHDAVPPSSGHSSVTTHTAELVSELPARCATPALVLGICRIPDAAQPLCTWGVHAPSMGTPPAPEHRLVASLELDKRTPTRCLVLGVAALSDKSTADDALDDKSVSVPVALEVALLAELRRWTVPKPDALAHTMCSTKCSDIKAHRPVPWPSFADDTIGFQFRPPWPSFKMASGGKFPSRTVMNLFRLCTSYAPRVTQTATQQLQFLEIDLQFSSRSPVLSWFVGGKLLECQWGAEHWLGGKDEAGSTNSFQGVGLVIGKRDADLQDAIGLQIISAHLRLFRVTEWKGMNQVANNCKRSSQDWYQYHTVQSARTHLSTTHVSVGRSRKCLHKTQGIFVGLSPWGNLDMRIPSRGQIDPMISWTWAVNTVLLGNDDNEVPRYVLPDKVLQQYEVQKQPWPPPLIFCENLLCDELQAIFGNFSCSVSCAMDEDQCSTKAKWCSTVLLLRVQEWAPDIRCLQPACVNSYALCWHGRCSIGVLQQVLVSGSVLTLFSSDSPNSFDVADLGEDAYQLKCTHITEGLTGEHLVEAVIRQIMQAKLPDTTSGNFLDHRSRLGFVIRGVPATWPHFSRIQILTLPSKEISFQTNPMSLQRYHSISTGTGFGVEWFNGILLQDCLLFQFIGHVSKCGFELLQWQIAWSHHLQCSEITRAELKETLRPVMDEEIIQTNFMLVCYGVAHVVVWYVFFTRFRSPRFTQQQCLSCSSQRTSYFQKEHVKLARFRTTSSLILLIVKRDYGSTWDTYLLLWSSMLFTVPLIVMVWISILASLCALACGLEQSKGSGELTQGMASNQHWKIQWEPGSCCVLHISERPEQHRDSMNILGHKLRPEGKHLCAPWDPGGGILQVFADCGLRASRMLRRGECHVPTVTWCHGLTEPWAGRWTGPAVSTHTTGEPALRSWHWDSLGYIRVERTHGIDIEEQNTEPALYPCIPNSESLSHPRL